jgi:hypothetical protein
LANLLGVSSGGAAMSARMLVWLGIDVCVVLMLWGLVRLGLGPTPGVREANFEHIHDGMTKAEVEAILGGPAQSGGPLAPCRSIRFPARGGWAVSEECWESAEGIVEIRFSSENLVVDSTSRAVRRVSLLERLRAWLGW